jgi:hypothetical protein
VTRSAADDRLECIFISKLISACRSFQLNFRRNAESGTNSADALAL